MSERGNNITGQSKVSIALLGGIFSVIVVATWGAASWATKVDGRLETIERSLTSVDRWTGVDMRFWAAELASENPTITVPHPTDAAASREEPR